MLARTFTLFLFLPLVPVLACESEQNGGSTPLTPDASSIAFDGGGTPGLDAGSSDTGSDAGPSTLLCDKYGSPLLAFSGPTYSVKSQPSADAAPAPAGGTIVDGIYVTTSNTSWGGSSSNADLRTILVLENGAWFYRIEFDNVDDQKMAGGFFTVDPVAKTVRFLNPECGGGGSPPDDVHGYTATATTFTTYLDKLVGPSDTRVVKEIVYTKQ